MAPKLVYFVLKKELLNHSESAPSSLVFMYLNVLLVFTPRWHSYIKRTLAYIWSIAPNKAGGINGLGKSKYGCRKPVAFSSEVFGVILKADVNK